jgi:hypothetical protein
MPLVLRVITALFTVAISFVLVAAAPTPTPTPKPANLDASLKCVAQPDASDSAKITCLNEVQQAIEKGGVDAADKAYPTLVQTCFKDPSFFVKLDAARMVARLNVNRDAIAPQELSLFLDPAVIGTSDCLNEASSMSDHLRVYTQKQKFSALVKMGMVDAVWNALLNGAPSVRGKVLQLFFPMLGNGTVTEMAPYRDDAERFFDWLFTPDASAMDYEDLITRPIDQTASILFAMGDSVFLGRHLLTPIQSYVLYPNPKNPNAVSPDAKWGYADDLNSELRPLLPVNFAINAAAAKVWADALQVLVIAQTPVKSERGCINRATAVENITFGGTEVEKLTVQTLADLAGETPHGKEYGQEARGCGELEARVVLRGS